MSKNQRTADMAQKSANQNNIMSKEDPDDGSRNSFVTGKDGTTPVEKKPPHDRQDQETIEAFGEEGAADGAEERSK